MFYVHWKIGYTSVGNITYSFNLFGEKTSLLQEVDSDDEWQGLIEQTDQEGDPDVALKLLQDIKFQNKLKSRIQTSSAQVLDGMLEGAARLKTVLRVITNLVTLKWYKLANWSYSIIIWSFFHVVLLLCLSK